MRHNFLCAECGYEAEVSGGNDAGMLVSTATIECIQCKTIRDVVTERRSEARAASFLLRCPRGKGHAIRRWTRGDACPRCGGEMRDGGIETLWD